MLRKFWIWLQIRLLASHIDWVRQIIAEAESNGEDTHRLQRVLAGYRCQLKALEFRQVNGRQALPG